MKYTLKYIAYIVACATTLIIMARIDQCSDTPGKEESVVVIPHDSFFVPVIKNEYRPRSTPFEKKGNKPALLPKDTPEANVARTIAIIKHIPVDTLGNYVRDTTNVVITKSGGVFVQKQEGVITTVGVTEYLPPILEWNLYVSAGVNISRSLSPSVSITPLKILGKISLPALNIDTEGVGIGVGWNYRDFLFGIMAHQRYDVDLSGIKLFVHYTF